MMGIAGCKIETLDDSACPRWLDFVLGRGQAPDDLGQHVWLLCHCDDGVTWGRRVGGEWRLGSTFFPDFCPVPTEENLQEMRVFSSLAEVLIWRAESGLRGRLVRDLEEGDPTSPDRPADEERVLLAGHLAGRREGFTHVRDGSGAEQILPVHIDDGPSPWPRLRVRHYFARDEQSGGIRVVVSRLVEVV